MKICSKCNIEQPIENFSIKNKQKGTRNAWCRECNRQYNKEHYQNNKDSYLEKSKKYEKNNRLYMYNYLKNHPCEECGETRIAALQFDHIDRKDKSFTVGHYGRRTGLIKLKKEIEKCRVLCANCHAVHTANQFGWYKDLE